MEILQSAHVSTGLYRNQCEYCQPWCQTFPGNPFKPPSPPSRKRAKPEERAAEAMECAHMTGKGVRDLGKLCSAHGALVMVTTLTGLLSQMGYLKTLNRFARTPKTFSTHTSSLWRGGSCRSPFPHPAVSKDKGCMM